MLAGLGGRCGRLDRLGTVLVGLAGLGTRLIGGGGTEGAGT